MPVLSPSVIGPNKQTSSKEWCAERSGKNFFNFYIFFDLSKIYAEFFFTKMSSCRQFIRRKVGTAGWTGGRFIPPFQSAVSGRVGGPWWAGNLPPVETAVGCYRRTNRRKDPPLKAAALRPAPLLALPAPPRSSARPSRPLPCAPAVPRPPLRGAAQPDAGARLGRPPAPARERSEGRRVLSQVHFKI